VKPAVSQRGDSGCLFQADAVHQRIGMTVDQLPLASLATEYQGDPQRQSCSGRPPTTARCRSIATSTAMLPDA